jgi:hypothetical protein
LPATLCDTFVRDMIDCISASCRDEQASGLCSPERMPDHAFLVIPSEVKESLNL